MTSSFFIGPKHRYLVGRVKDNSSASVYPRRLNDQNITMEGHLNPASVLRVSQKKPGQTRCTNNCNQLVENFTAILLLIWISTNLHNTLCILEIIPTIRCITAVRIFRLFQLTYNACSPNILVLFGTCCDLNKLSITHDFRPAKC